jgi:hypothetical protein
MYPATTLPEFLLADRWSGVFTGVTYILAVWSVAIYTREQPMPVLGVLTALFAILVAVHVTRVNLIHGEIMEVEPPATKKSAGVSAQLDSTRMAR